ncbi:MAG: hypothetical protein KC423_23090 [Anaerolineales bacterium]|nr:hypothetical protein [Anaerolineales bacterium]
MIVGQWAETAVSPCYTSFCKRNKLSPLSFFLLLFFCSATLPAWRFAFPNSPSMTFIALPHAVCYY